MRTKTQASKVKKHTALERLVEHHSLLWCASLLQEGGGLGDERALDCLEQIYEDQSRRAAANYVPEELEEDDLGGLPPGLEVPPQLPDGSLRYYTREHWPTRIEATKRARPSRTLVHWPQMMRSTPSLHWKPRPIKRGANRQKRGSGIPECGSPQMKCLGQREAAFLSTAMHGDGARDS